MANQIKDEIIKIIQKVVGKETVVVLVDPPSVAMGDFSFPCFDLAKEQEKSPVEISTELKLKIENLKLEILNKVESVGPYLNFFVDKKVWNEEVMTADPEKVKFPKRKQKLMVEYSGPNPGKGFHVGHLRNTVLGIALINLLEALGYKVMPVNYLNDTGTHMAKVIWMMQNFYAGQTPRKNKGEWLGRIYAEAEDKLQNNPEGKKEIDEIHRRLEKKDKEIMAYWRQVVDWSLEDFDNIYRQLGAKFKKIYWDRDYINQGKKIVDELLKKGIAKRSEGAIIVDLEKYHLPTLIVLKSDGSAVYITKDFAMARERFRKYHPDRIIYVVGSEQKLHFQQLFKILELYGFKQARDCYHLSYELVRLKEGKMSSRAGNIILYQDLYREGMIRAFRETLARHPDWPRKRLQSAAKRITLAALKFDMLKCDPNQLIVFDLEKALSFEGDTGPYLLYTYARVCSIKKRIKNQESRIKNKKINYSLLNKLEEKILIKDISKLGEIIFEAGKNYRPSVLANYLLRLAQDFNSFYHTHQVIDEKNPELTAARLKLADVAGATIKRGLELLGIEVVEEM